MCKRFCLLLMVCCVSMISLQCASGTSARQEQSLVHLQLSGAYLRKGDVNSALTELLKAETLNPSDPDVHNALGLVYSVKEEYSKAIFHFDKALKLKQEYPEVHNNLGTMYLKQKKWDLAIKHFEKALSCSSYGTPQFAYLNLGLAHYHKGMPEKSIHSLTEAIKISSGYAQAYNALGLVYADMHRWREAIHQYQLAIHYSPNYLDAHYNLGLAYKGADCEEKAKEVFENIIKVAPGSRYSDLARNLLESR